MAGIWLKQGVFHDKIKLGVSEVQSKSEVYTEKMNYTDSEPESIIEHKQDLVEYFENHRAENIKKGMVTKNKNNFLYVARPIFVHRSCLTCHGGGSSGKKVQKVNFRAATKPAGKLNRIAGVLITYLPLEPVLENSEMATFKIVAAGIGIALMVLLAIWFYVDSAVTKPLDDLTKLVDEMSRGERLKETIKTARKDEIGQLYRAFNRMRVSVLRLLELVGNKAG